MTMMHNPSKVREDLTSYDLIENYEVSLRERIKIEQDHYISMYDGISARFSSIAEGRSVSIAKQFELIFIRNIKYLARNPRTI